MTGIADCYADKCVFITGATGFLGKVLISKILISCPEVRKIYVLIRAKSKQSPQERLGTLLEAALFSGIPAGVKRKVVALVGDITEPELGLSEPDKDELIRNVSFIFHSAATVKFDEKLDLSVLINVQGTISVLDLAKRIKKLEAFVHVSTAFCNPQVPVLEERVYQEDMPYSPEDILRLIREKGDAINEKSETEKILGSWPNTYTFTKAIGERVISDNFDQVPLAIMRPSIVVAALKEPIPGWVDNYNGMTGLIVATGTGLLRTMLVYRRCVADIIPVDICINLLLAIATSVSKKNAARINSNNNGDYIADDEVPVYNCVSGDDNPITWGEIENDGVRILTEYPFENMHWYPSGGFNDSAVLNRVRQALYHQAPSYALDAFQALRGAKPLFRSYVRKMTRAFSVLEYFTTRKWNFLSPRVRKLFSELREEDRETFGFDVKTIVWRPFLRSYVLGTRQYVLKNDPATLEECRRKLKYFKLLDVAFKMLLCFVLYKLLIMFYNVFQTS